MKTKKNIVFRVDSSLFIGNGHIIRSIALANYFKKIGCCIYFISSNHLGNENRLIIKSGLNLYELKKNPDLIDTNNELMWLGSSQEIEINQTVKILKKIKNVSIIVVDHYSINIDWEIKIKKYCKKLLVIDDFSNRYHNCDFYLNPSYTESKEILRKYLNRKSQLFLGPKYAILREQFLKYRTQSRRKRLNTNCPNRILIFMGSSDTKNLIPFIIDSLTSLQIDLNFVIILKNNSINYKILKKKIVKLKNVKIIKKVNNMAFLMLHSDLMIGTPGSSLWERCCLGLPSISIQTEKNQKNIVNFSKKNQISLNIGKYDKLNKEKIKKSFLKLYLNHSLRKIMINNMFELVDPNGCKRIINKIQVYEK